MKRALIAGMAAVALALGLPARSAPAPGTHETQGYLGVDIRDVTDDRAHALKLKEARGAEICVIDHDGPAVKAGLRVSDVILQMNGQRIEGEEQLRRMLRETPARHTVNFVFSRDGRQQTISVQLADREEVERSAWEQHFAVPQPPPDDAMTIPDPMDDAAPGPAAQEQPRSYPGFGFMGPVILSSTYTGAVLDALGPQLAQFFGAQPGTGLLVKSVDADSPAARAGLRAGDVVVRMNGQSVSSREDWLHALQASHGKSIAVNVLRDRQAHTLTMALTPAKKHSELLPPPPIPAWPAAPIAYNR
jgi:S1-C subfamily serine protease